MRNDTRKNKPSRFGRNVRKSETFGSKTLEETFLQHTAREREQMQTGLRILARIIARAHLRRQASGTATAPPPNKEPGDKKLPGEKPRRANSPQRLGSVPRR